MMKLLKKIKSILIGIWHLFVGAGKGFDEDRIPKLSAALAYYTIFSLSPLIIIIIASASLIYSQDAIENKLFSQINELVGREAAVQIQGFVANASLSGKSSLALVIGIIVLIIGATAVFTEIQDSINQIWKVKAIPKKGWKKLIMNRLLSFSLIVSLGFLLLVSLVINSLVLSLGNKISQMIPEISQSTQFVILIINNVLTFAVVTGIFMVIFKVLPDVILKWKSAFVGAVFTAILFGLGKYIIGLYLQKANPGLIFGSASSLIIILVWIYYTSIILYFGAEFTQAYAEKHENGIQPSKYAVHLKTITIEKKVDTLPAQHPEETKKDKSES